MDERQPATCNLLGLPLPWKLTLAVVLSTLLIMIDFYYLHGERLLPGGTPAEALRREFTVHLGMYLLLPLIVIVLIFRDRPADYGFTLGDWRAGLRWTLAAGLIAAPVLVLSARTPEMAAYYARYRASPVEVIFTAGLGLLSWEFLFRGFLQFSLFRVVGPAAVVLQAVPFALAHLTKPPLETLSTIFGGIAFGWVAWRTRSFIYPFLIHWFVLTVVIVAAMSSA